MGCHKNPEVQVTGLMQPEYNELSQENPEVKVTGLLQDPVNVQQICFIAALAITTLANKQP